MEADDELFRPPNDGAYTKEELRRGPPLEYVAEKTRRTLESLHEVLHRSDPPSDSQVSLRYAFYNVLVAHLALKNMLALVNERGADDRLLSMSRQHFEQWLDRVDQEGIVSE